MKYINSILILLLLILTAAAVFSSDERVYWSTMSDGSVTDTVHTSTNYRMFGTFSQTAVQGGSSTNYAVNHGFWQVFDTIAVTCDCVPGDANDDSNIDLLDILYLIDYKNKGGPAPTPYEVCSGDVNCDCIINLLDILYLTDFKYKGGPAPCDCQDWVDSCGIPIIK